MTENEAIEWLAEETSPTLIHIAEMKKENPMEYINEAVKVACHALEEIQQYRELGTVELLIKSNAKALFEHVELEQYRAIGTVEGYDRAIKTSKENYLLYAEYKSKVKEFESIGTIEEIKEKLSLLEKYEELGTVEELDEVLNMIC